MSNKNLNKSSQKNKRQGEQGFSMIEVVVAIFILTIGLIGTAAALTFALEFGALSKNISGAKTVITSTIEEIESLRNSRRLEFKQIENVGSVDNTGSANTFSGFSTGFNPVSLSPGPDGVNGTNDDLTDPGPDGTFGTTDDTINEDIARKGFTRRITITNLTGSVTIKKIEISVRYEAAAGKIGEVTSVAYLNDEARVTR